MRGAIAQEAVGSAGVVAVIAVEGGGVDAGEEGAGGIEVG